MKGITESKNTTLKIATKKTQKPDILPYRQAPYVSNIVLTLLKRNNTHFCKRGLSSEEGRKIAIFAKSKGSLLYKFHYDKEC